MTTLSQRGGVAVPATMRYHDKTAVVTGAARGIGAATVRRLAAEGAAVVCVDTAPIVEDVAAAVVADGGTAVAVQGDVAEPALWSAAVQAAHQVRGPLDLLVSNAAIQEVAPAHEMDIESWDRQIAVNLTAAFLGVRAGLEDLQSRRGAVVMTASVHALFGFLGHPAYAASKGGLTALTRQLAVEYGPQVRVNAVLPGPIRTRAWDRVTPDDQARVASATPAGRFGEPEEVASTIAFLGSEDASFVTGASLLVDGGWSVVMGPG
jgi:NAD(P)-dependent dehydrogenase (short-subunit alcohol dehydrogenase family)